MSRTLKTLSSRVEKLEESLKPKPRFVHAIHSLCGAETQEEAVERAAIEQGLGEISDEDYAVVIQVS